MAEKIIRDVTDEKMPTTVAFMRRLHLEAFSFRVLSLLRYLNVQDRVRGMWEYVGRGL